MDPCGTPQGTTMGSEKIPSTSVFWNLFFKYDENQDVERSSKPIAFSLFNNMSWSTVSKAFLKVDHDHASIVPFIHVKSDLVCQLR